MVKAAPIVRKMASEAGVDLEDIKGTGKNGAITKADYLAHTGEEEKPVVNKRKQEERSPMNHAKHNETEIGGMKFRRSRTGLDHSNKLTLDIPSKYKNNELKYRWVKESDGRVERLRELGYEVVDPTSLSKDEEISIRRRVGTAKDGSDLNFVLMATPKDWYQERHKKAEQERRSREEGMMNTPSDKDGKLPEGEFYNKGSRFGKM